VTFQVSRPGSRREVAGVRQCSRGGIWGKRLLVWDRMIARVATFTPLPDALEGSAVELLRSTVKQTRGYVAEFHLHDPRTNKAMSITIYEDREALRRVGAALSARPEGSNAGIDPSIVEFFEAVPF
jgi:hypothetical protein